jgi:hypothetical protein
MMVTVVLLSVVALHYIAVEVLLCTEAQQVLAVTVNRKIFLNRLILILICLDCHRHLGKVMYYLSVVYVVISN